MMPYTLPIRPTAVLSMADEIIALVVQTWENKYTEHDIQL